MNNFLRTLLFLSGTKFGCGFSPGMGPIGPINILELRECDPPINNINGDIKLHTEKDKSKSVSFSFDTAQDYGDELSHSMLTSGRITPGRRTSTLTTGTFLIL
jgi:hypothetical protein